MWEMRGYRLFVLIKVRPGVDSVELQEVILSLSGRAESKPDSRTKGIRRARRIVSKLFGAA